MRTSAPETVLAKPRGKAGRPRKEEKQPYLRGEIVRVYGVTGNLTQTAEALGIDRGTLADIFARNPDDFSTAQKLHASNLLADADTCRALSMQPERLAECTSPQLAVMVGIYTQRTGEILASPAIRMLPPSDNPSHIPPDAPTLAEAIRLLVGSGSGKVIASRTTESVALSAKDSSQPVKIEAVTPPSVPQGEQTD
jgi:hypothetical protein